MFKIFKNVDEKFNDKGFIKTEDNKFAVRYIKQYNDYIQILDICRKFGGQAIVQSYVKQAIYDHNNPCQLTSCVVGLTYDEMKLVLKKIKEKGWK